MLLAVLLPILKKFSPYMIAAVFFFVAGSFAGFRFEKGAVEAAQLALMTQQKNDAAAVAAANAIAVSNLVQADAKANAAEAQLAAANAQEGEQDGALAGRIAMQATQPGQDAPDAPVLAVTLDALAKGSP